MSTGSIPGQGPLPLRVTRGLLEPGARSGLSPRRLAETLANDLREIVRDRHVLTNLASTQLQVRYQHSVLGFAWTFLHPALMLLVLAVVFTRLLGRDIPNYPLYLFSGLVPWQFFHAAMTNGSNSLLKHQAILRKVYVHRMVFPLAEVAVEALNNVFTMAALFCVLLLIDATLSVHVVLVLPGLLLLALFTVGAVLVGVILLTYFRDFKHLISIGLQMLYFGSPILYRQEMLGELGPWLALNPITHLLRIFRCAFYDFVWPSPAEWGLAGLAAASSLVLGLLVFKRFERDLVFRV